MTILFIQQPDVRGQTGVARLTTVLGDLARSVPQDRTGFFNALAPPIVLATLPRSVQDAAFSRRLRFHANNTVQVYILVAEVSDEIVQRLISTGAQVEFVDLAARRVQARVPAKSLQRIASLPFVSFIRLPSYATRHSGSVTTEGDVIHSSQIARTQFGVDGSNVKVGVISDGIKGVFDTKCQTCRGLGDGPIASGDLPDAEGRRRNGLLVASEGGIVGRSFRSDQDLEASPSFFRPCAFRGAGAEGTALLEIVHDVAPRAQLSFANADTSLAFNAAVNALSAENDIVVDDLGFFGEPADGQSSVSRNTAAALNNPNNRIRAYITSAGNMATDHYFGSYVDSGRDARTVSGITASGRLHLFQGTTDTSDVLGLGQQPYDVISLPTNAEVVVALTWNDPWGQSSNNYDLFLVDDDTGEVVARSTDVQRGQQDPLETIDFLNRGESGLFRILVQNVGDDAAIRQLNMFAVQPQCAPDGPRRLAAGRHERHNYNTASRSVPAQSDSGGSPVSAISVGAICSASAAGSAAFADTEAPSESCSDPSHSTIQFFSSRGPTLDGRLKPDIVAIDGVSVSGAGRFPKTFFGTSAAAAHAAGIAALVLHAAPCLGAVSPGVGAEAGRTMLRGIVVESADPIGGSEPNPTFGFGLANAFRSVERALLVCGGSAPPTPTPPPPPPLPPVPGGPTTSTITQLSGPTVIQNGQQVWKFHSVEGPAWDSARWGTNTHRFNVTVVPGAGALPVTLMLHSATGNGPREPDEFIDTLTPGIYISPVDLSYQHGLIDPVTGQGRFFSRWMGYTDAANVYQPVTADRVVRYVQWVLTQSAKWPVDPARVYVYGGSMGGGGAMHLAALHPTVFAAGVSGTGWIDLNAWAPANDQCQPGLRWRTPTGPLCTEMLDQVYLTQQAAGDLPPLMLTWNSNDGTVSPARYPELIATLEATRQGYVAEWQFNTNNNHQFFVLPGNPQHRYRLNAPFVVFTGGGSATSSPAGTRQTDRTWSNLTESSTQLTVTLTGSGASSITIRRRQSFRPAPGTTVRWTTGSTSGSVTVAPDGTITIPAVTLSPAGAMLQMTAGS